MHVTEREAQNLQCRAYGGAVTNDGKVNFHPCIGSKCMHWTWLDFPELRFKPAHDFKETEESERPADIPSSWTWRPYSKLMLKPAGWVESPEEAAPRRKGHCGLGG